MSDPTDNPVRCGLPATVAVEAYRPGESGGTYGKLDTSHYTCADPEHVTAAEALVAVAGMTAFRRVGRSRTASRRCGDRFDYTTMKLDAARPAVCGATADEVGGPADWVCERAPEHGPNEPHRTYAGQVWEETTWRPAVVPPFDPRGFRPGEVVVLPPGATVVAVAPSAPETASDVLRALADALEQLPPPFSLRFDSAPGHQPSASAWFHARDDMEQWRQWVGAPAPAGQWEPSSTGGMVRRWRTTVTWGRHEVELTWPEHRREPETPAEKRERLAEELAELDQKIAATGQHPDLVGETDPEVIKATLDAVAADEQSRRDALVAGRFSTGTTPEVS